MSTASQRRCLSASIYEEPDEFLEESSENEEDQKIPEPINSDAEYDTDIELENRKEGYDATGRTAYLEACKKYKTNTISYFMKHMGDTEINMAYHGIGSKGAKAISHALVANTVTLKLNLKENSIGPEGVRLICEMLKENCYINDLNLSRNYLGIEGCKNVSEMLQYNINLRKLDLSHNGFGDNVGKELVDAFRNNYKLIALDLSGNNLSENVGVAIGPAINANDAIEVLNLSWNQLRSKATHEIAMGLRANCTLRIVDLSWNGFSSAGAIALADAIKVNNTLTELNLSHNRIGLDGAMAFAKALDANNTLEILNLDGNSMTCKGAHSILHSVINKSDSAIRELHMQGVSVNDEFKELYDSSKEVREIAVTACFRVPSPLEVIQIFLKKYKEEWKEAFIEMDSLECSRVTVNQFKSILEKFEFKFSTEEQFGLLGKLKKDSRGHIKYKDPLLGFEREVTSIEK